MDALSYGTVHAINKINKINKKNLINIIRVTKKGIRTWVGILVPNLGA